MTTEKKTHFSLACSLLSKMVKEKQGRSVGTIEMHCRQQPPPPPTITMDLLSGIDDASGAADVDRSSTTAKPRELTIFYDGKMFVFDDIPEGKANELMQTASASLNRHRPAPKRCSSISSTDLMLAQTRRASLHGFLNKRKERIIASAPYYQIPYGSPPPMMMKKMMVAATSNPNPEESTPQSWLTLGPQITGSFGTRRERSRMRVV